MWMNLRRAWLRGVMVITSDSESDNLSSNLGATNFFAVPATPYLTQACTINAIL
jgi:hypothetical protein